MEKRGLSSPMHSSWEVEGYAGDSSSPVVSLKTLVACPASPSSCPPRGPTLAFSQPCTGKVRRPGVWLVLLLLSGQVDMRTGHCLRFSKT